MYYSYCKESLMDLTALSEEFANAPIERIILKDGSEVKVKKIPRQAIAAMDSFIPGIKDISLTISTSLPTITTLGKQKLFIANGNITQYLRKKGSS